MSNTLKYNDTIVSRYMMIAKYRADQTDWEDMEDVLVQAKVYIDMFLNDDRYINIWYLKDYIDIVKPKYYHWHLDGDTLWIIDYKDNVAYETRQYTDWVDPNGIFITHDMSQWDKTYMCYIEHTKNVTVPNWVLDILK